MKRFTKYICWLIFALLLFSSKANAEVLTYKSILKTAIDNSFDIKISNLDIDISKAELKAAKADLFPIISTQVNAEYNNGLGNTSNINYAGNTVVSSYTQFRNLAFIGLQYNLFDFGATGKKILIAKNNVDQKKLMVDLQLKDLKLKVLELYSKSLQSSEEVKMKTEILKVYEEMFQAKERLFKAGTTDRISVMQEAVKIARTQDDIYNSKLELKNSLSDLSTYTMQKYNSDNVDVLDFEELNIQSNIVPVGNFEPLKAKIAEKEVDFSFDPAKSIESRYYDFELEKKKAELEMFKRQRYPSFRFYTNYLFYGQDPNNYVESLSNFKQASLAFGITGSFALFDGFKNKANKEKAALEIKKIQLEKEKKLAEIKTQYEKSKDSYEVYTEELSLKKELLITVRNKLDAIERMYKNGLIEKNELLSAKADLLSQEFDLQKNIINISSKIKEIEIMTGRDT